MDIDTYVTKHPVFDSVKGFQTDFSFLTEEIVDHMKKAVRKSLDDVDVSLYSFPLDEERALDLVYNYTSCMTKCKGGEITGASMVARCADF